MVLLQMRSPVLHVSCHCGLMAEVCYCFSTSVFADAAKARRANHGGLDPPQFIFLVYKRGFHHHHHHHAFISLQRNEALVAHSLKILGPTSGYAHDFQCGPVWSDLITITGQLIFNDLVLMLRVSFIKPGDGHCKYIFILSSLIFLSPMSSWMIRENRPAQRRYVWIPCH